MNYKVQKFNISYVKERDTLNKAIAEKRVISSKYDVTEFIKNYLNDLPIEKVCVIALGNKNDIIGFIQFQGTVNQSAVYPREVFSFLLSCGAASFILSHNHPGGSLNASEADWLVTEKLYQSGKNLDIPLLDHVILADEKTVSLRESARWPR